MDDKITLKLMAGPDHMKTIFRRLKSYADICKQQVLKRFESKEIWKNARIFDADFKNTAPVVQSSVQEIAAYLTRPC